MQNQFARSNSFHYYYLVRVEVIETSSPDWKSGTLSRCAIPAFEFSTLNQETFYENSNSPYRSGSERNRNVHSGPRRIVAREQP